MYIEVTVDLKNYTGERFDIRLSDYYTAKQFINVVWQVQSIQVVPREGYWIRVQNKNLVLAGSDQLARNGIMSGDCLEIL